MYIVHATERQMIENSKPFTRSEVRRLAVGGLEQARARDVFVVLKHCWHALTLQILLSTEVLNGRASDYPLYHLRHRHYTMELVVPALLLLRSIHATALASEANANVQRWRWSPSTAPLLPQLSMIQGPCVGI